MRNCVIGRWVISIVDVKLKLESVGGVWILGWGNGVFICNEKLKILFVKKWWILFDNKR